MNISSQVNGIHNVLKNMADKQKKHEEAVLKALKENAFDLISKSEPMVPVDKGPLKASWVVSVNGKQTTQGPDADIQDPTLLKKRHKGTDKQEVIVGYFTEYAWEQHENLAYYHDDGEAKFLEKAYEQNKRKYQQNLADAARDALK
ncbi:hypothetical protein QYF48_16190 [Brevibacillus agri]|uniref:HK97 gp10 family phage protein n=1 Tax=Brevibacillus agri TaxID=51101 RepID=UPI0025B726DD|nr:HK97 gp10 family phage protein [Brevibacillus agri]MDN4094349.1 hypothetical protein [Brevibacillus agri]